MLISPRYDGPTIMTMDGPADAVRAPLVRQRRRLAAVCAELSEDDWAAPTRCAGWRVQDVIAHLVGVNGFWQLSITAGLAGEPTRVLAGFDPAATPDVMVDGMRSMTAGETLDQFVASNGGLLEVVDGLDAAGWSTVAESPPGHVSVGALAHHALWDAWVHERDIVIPLGRSQAIEDDEVIACLRYAAAISPALALTNGTATSGSYGVAAITPDTEFVIDVGDTVEVRNTLVADRPTLRGDASELIDALTMRAPLPTDAPSEWTTLIRGLATAFDQ